MKNFVGERLAWALAHGASKKTTLLARAENLLVPDDRTGVISSPAKLCITLIKHSEHLRTLEKCGKHSPAADVFYISLVFSNARHVLSQCVIHGLGLFIC